MFLKIGVFLVQELVLRNVFHFIKKGSYNIEFTHYSTQ